VKNTCHLLLLVLFLPVLFVDVTFLFLDFVFVFDFACVLLRLAEPITLDFDVLRICLMVSCVPIEAIVPL
jgi:hypothetical protein